MKSKQILLPLLAFSSLSVWAQDNNSGDDLYAANAIDPELNNNERIVVSATRIETDMSKTGSSVSIINEEEIALSHVNSVHESLKGISGLQFTQNGGPGTNSSVFLRGMNSKHTVVLVNGIRINSNTTGSSNLSTIPAHLISKIEVLKGPQSSIYGADALGGVISITTKQSKVNGHSGDFSYEMGNLGFIKSTASYSFKNEHIDILTSLSYEELTDHSIAPEGEGNKEDDESSLFSAYTNVGVNFWEDARLDFTLSYTESEVDTDGSDWFTGKIIDNDDYNDTDTIILNAKFTKTITDTLDLNINAGYSESETLGMGYSPIEYISQNTVFTAFSNLYLTDSITVSSGFELKKEEAENKYNFKNYTHDTYGIFSLVSFESEKLSTTASVRYDDFDIDEKTTGRMTAALNLFEGNRIHSSASTGFKTPTINDLYWPGSGNPDLNPEESWGFDLGVEQVMMDGKLIFDITYFYQDIDDLINWAPGADGYWKPYNVDSSEHQGLEFSFDAIINEVFSLNGSYTYTHAVDKSTNKQLVRRARNTASLTLGIDPIEQLSIDLTAQFIDDRQDTNGGLDSYLLGNVVVNYSIDTYNSVFLRVDNFADVHYQEAYGYATLGCNGSLGYKFSF